MGILESLKDFGLSEKEAKVYLTGLELGVSSAGDISVKSRLPRTLVYDLLDRLISLGLSSYSIQENKKFFSMANPRELINILNSKKESISKVLPELEKLKKEQIGKRPKVEIFDGKEGIRTMMNLLISKPCDKMLVYGGSRSFYEVDPFFIDKWHKERIKKKIHLLRIYDNVKETREKLKEYKESLELTNYKFLPVSAKSPTPTIIWGDYLILFHLEKKNAYAVLIEDKSITDNHKEYFMSLWKIANSR